MNIVNKYHNSSTLLLRDFIIIDESNAFDLLLLKVDDELDDSAIEAWEEIIEDYNDITNADNSSLLFTLHQENRQRHRLNAFIGIYEVWHFDADFRNEKLLELGHSRIKTKEQLGSRIQNMLTRLKMQKESKDEIKKTDWWELLAMLQTDTKPPVHVDADKTTVKQFAYIIKRVSSRKSKK